MSVGVVAPQSQVPTGLQRPLHLCGDPVTLDLRASVSRIALIHADALCLAGRLSVETWFCGDALRSPRRSRVLSSPPSLVPTGPGVRMPLTRLPTQVRLRSIRGKPGAPGCELRPRTPVRPDPGR